MFTKIKIRQIYFKPEQKEKLSPLFIPYDNSETEEPEWVEYGVILKSYRMGFYKSAEYTGVVSWRFEEKIKLEAEKFLEFIKDNPGYDVYFINPFHAISVLYNNIWRQGDDVHPGLMKLAQEIFNNVGYDINLKKVISKKEEILFSNYWVGNQKFWEKYIQFSEPIYEYIKNLPDGKLKKRIYSDAKYLYKVSNIPFIMERVFNTLLFVDKEIKYKSCMLNDREEEYARVLNWKNMLKKYFGQYSNSILIFLLKIYLKLPYFLRHFIKN